MEPLIVVGAAAFKTLVAETHSLSGSVGGSALSHIGQRKTMRALSSQYFAFGMRRIINEYISNCATCRLNTHPKTRPEKDGEHISMEPNSYMQCDFAGPLHAFKGRGKYFILFVDCSSRYVFTFVTTSTSDDETLKAVIQLRRQLCGLPQKLSADNALFTKHSKTKKFLVDNGVSILHGHAFVSRSQSKAEKAIGTISRLVLKYQTERPKATLEDLVNEATTTYNSTPCDALPGSMAPKNLHFARPPTSFLRTAADVDDRTGNKNVLEAAAVARAAGRETLRFDVENHLRRQTLRSPTNFTLRLKPGDCCLKKRTTWPSGVPKKCGFRVTTDGYVITRRVATNSFQCRSVLTGEVYVLPGDLLIRLKDFDEDRLRRLCIRLDETLERTNAAVEPRVLRSRGNVGSNISSMTSRRSLFFFGSEGEGDEDAEFWVDGEGEENISIDLLFGTET